MFIEFILSLFLAFIIHLVSPSLFRLLSRAIVYTEFDRQTETFMHMEEQ